MKRKLAAFIVLTVMVFCIVPKAFADAGEYNVSLTPRGQDGSVGQSAKVYVELTSPNNNVFSSLDATIEYDGQKLEFDPSSSIGLEAYSVKKSAQSIHIIGFGADKPLGNILCLSFKLKAEGEAKVTLVDCKADNSENAATKDAPQANITEAVAVINIIKTAPQTGGDEGGFKPMPTEGGNNDGDSGSYTPSTGKIPQTGDGDVPYLGIGCILGAFICLSATKQKTKNNSI